MAYIEKLRELVSLLAQAATIVRQYEDTGFSARFQNPQEFGDFLDSARIKLENGDLSVLSSVETVFAPTGSWDETVGAAGMALANRVGTLINGINKNISVHKPMHILLIHQAFAALDEAGGTRHHELARFLARKGHQVTVIASPVSYLTGTGSTSSVASNGADGVTILRAYTYNALHKSFVHRFFSFLSFMFSSFFIGLGVKNVDVVWGTSPPIFQGLTAWALARLKRARFLFEVRDLWPDFAIAVGVLKSPLLIRLTLWLERFLYSHADQMMVNSPGYMQHVRSRGAKSVELVPNGADPGMFDPMDEGRAFRQAHGLEGCFVALYAGAHGMSNDLNVVLDAARLLAADTTIRIVLLGDGKEKAHLQARAAEMGLGNLLFLPSVPKSEMARALAGADACIAILKALDEYKTTYPNKVFDYMAAGRPVVLAIDGVIREVVDQAQCGVFVAPGSALEMAAAIQNMAADRNRAAALGMNGRYYLEAHFSRESLAEKLCRIFEELA